MTPTLARISLAALLFAAAAPATARASDGKDALDLVPDWAGSVVVLNAEHMRRSSLFDDVMSLVENAGGMRADAALLRDAGFDLRRDLQTVVLASQPDDPTKSLLLVQGRIDTDKLLGRAVKKGGARRTYHKQTYVEVSKGKLSIAELGDYLVIAPSPRHLEAVIDVQQGKRASVRRNRALMSLVDRTDQGGDLWMVVGVDRKKGGDEEALHDLRTVTASLDVVRGLRMQVRLYAGSDQGATDLARYLAQLGQQSDDRPGLAGLLGKLSIKRIGRRVDASMKLTASELDSLSRKLLAAK
jgi:hypothetical protein